MCQSFFLKPYSYEHHATLQTKCGKLDRGEQVIGMLMYIVDIYLETVSQQVNHLMQALYHYQAYES